jgi:UDP-glucose:glycoprotein glucosyltransferase
VSLGVVAPWYEVPIFEQFLFVIADYSEVSALSFLGSVLSANQTDNQSFLLASVKSFLPQDDMGLMRAQIELGFYLPRAEMYRETARSIDGTHYRDVFSVGAPVHDSIPHLRSDFSRYDFDISVGRPSSSIVYANLHNVTVATLILSLIRDQVDFVLRPLGQTDKFGVNLRGFGIEMRPFRYSMEYGVKDTAALNETQSGQTDDVQDATVSRISGIPNSSYVNVSAIERFGPRFSGFVKQRLDNKTNLLTLLRDVTHNVPLFVPEIAASEPDELSYRMIDDAVHSSGGRTWSVLNGRMLQTKGLDIFTLLAAVHEEKTLIRVMSDYLKMPRSQVQKFSYLSDQGNAQVVLNYSSPYICWWNDLETDPAYADWPNTMEAFLASGRYLPRIRRNLLNLVFYGEGSGSAFLAQLFGLSYLADQYHLRVGVLPHFSMSNKLSRIVGYAYHHLALRDSRSAVEFLLGTVRFCGLDSSSRINQVTEAHFAGSYTNIAKTLPGVIPWGELHNRFEMESPESRRLEGSHAALNDFGIHHEQMLLNGIPIESGLQGLVRDVPQMIRMMQRICMQEHILSLDGIDDVGILSHFLLVVPALDSLLFDGRPVGLGLVHRTLAQQTAFLERVSHIEWNFTDPGKISAFYVLFSKNQTEIEMFMRFAKGKHSVPSVFAINPEIPDFINSSDTVLIADGRIFYEFTPTGLQLIDLWVSTAVAGAVSPIVNRILHRRTTALYYLSCIFVDWLSEPVQRGSISEDAWAHTAPLIHSLNRDDELHWDLVIDPFTREYQRIADLVDYVDRNQVVDVRLMAAVPSHVMEPLQTYYRNALTQDRVVFTFLNDTTTYSAMPDMPDSWIVESMKAVVDLDNILLSELSPAVHQGTYVLTNIKAEGLCMVNNQTYADGAELALFDARGVRKADTIVMRMPSYWQLAANPG